MRSVVDDIRAEIETRAGSEESRALIINRLVSGELRLEYLPV
jgi:hypothetical protein